MEPRFTRGEYWLLETVVEQKWEICALIWSELEIVLNKKGHGLTRASLVETFHRLLSSGLIYAKNEATGFISTPEQIERALDEIESRRVDPVNEKEFTYYGLTQEGGAQWEAFAAPDWRKYIDGGFHFPEESEYEYEIWEVIGVDKSRVEKWIESTCSHVNTEVILASVEWDYIAPWQATYWKQLEGAYRVRFQGQEDTQEYSTPPSSVAYFDSIWYAWR